MLKDILFVFCAAVLVVLFLTHYQAGTSSSSHDETSEPFDNAYRIADQAIGRDIVQHMSTLNQTNGPETVTHGYDVTDPNSLKNAIVSINTGDKSMETVKGDNYQVFGSVQLEIDQTGSDQFGYNMGNRRHTDQDVEFQVVKTAGMNFNRGRFQPGKYEGPTVVDALHEQHYSAPGGIGKFLEQQIQ